MRSAEIVLATCGLVAVGCLPPDPPVGTPGEMGQGVFAYSCDSPTDPVCDDGVDAHAMPSAVAVASRFSASFTPVGENLGSAMVEAAASDLLSPTHGLGSRGSSFSAMAPGIAALLARRGDTVVDFVHVRIASPEAIAFGLEPVADDGSGSADPTRIEPITLLALADGEQAVIRAVSVDGMGEVLAGALSCSWTGSDDGLLTLESAAQGQDTLSIRAHGAGSTVLHVDLGGLQADLPIEVGLGAGGAGAGGGGGGGGEAGGSTGGAGGAGGAGGGS